MKRILLYSTLFATLFMACLGVANAQNEGVITMKTTQKKGQDIILEIEAVGTTDEEKANFTVEGATLRGKDKPNGFIYYTVLDEEGNITIKGDIKVLYCFFSHLTHIDISQATNLEIFSCHENLITEIDVSQNRRLKALTVSKNNIKKINVGQNGLLQALAVADNEISELDITNNVNLWLLACGNNNLKELNVRENEQLQTMRCEGNQLTELDLSNNGFLIEVNCSRNNIKGTAMDKLIEGLPDHSQNPDGRAMFAVIDNTIAPPDGNVCTVDQVNKALALGWIANEKVGDDEWKEYAGSPNAVQEVLEFDSADIEEIYSIEGYRLDRLQKGVNLIRLTNGEVRKVVIGN